MVETRLPAVHSKRIVSAKNFLGRVRPVDLPGRPKRVAAVGVALVLIHLAVLCPAHGGDPFGRGALEGRNTPKRGYANRVVSLTPSVTETLFALGAGQRVVGVSRYCDYPPEVTLLPRVGTFLVPVVEAVASLAPDLVITSPTPGNQGAVEALERAGLRVAIVQEGSAGIADVRQMIAATAELVDLEIEGAALVTSLGSALEEVRKEVAGRPPRSVAVVLGHEPLVLAGPTSYLGELVVVAGGRNIADSLGGKWPRVGWEFLIAAEPEVIIDASSDVAGATEAERLARAWSRYQMLPAVRDGRIHGHGGFLLLRPGPRLGDAARVMAGWIHPEAWLSDH
jgi:iron complex transport system substrate-binding protein